MHHHLPHVGFFYLIYALIVLAGGLYGYFKAQSKPSLIAGSVSAALLLLAAVIFRHHPQLSLLLGALISLTLTIIFYRRYQETQKPMPAIPVGILSILMFLYSIITLIRVHHMLHRS